jgi:hypothetical protein
MALDRLSAQAQERLGARACRPVAQLCPEEGGAGARETMKETFQDDDTCSESDGVRVGSAVACLAASTISLRAAEYLVWQQPCECAPRRVPALTDGVYGVLSTTASIVACLAVTDLNAPRRAQFRRISARMSELLADLQELSRSDT